MLFQSRDPDLATVLRRIEQGVYDLQPDFQRREVWSVGKKQRLVDSILRNWHIPPIHLVAKDDGQFDVLDGQQRLTAIRDFMWNGFPVDGKIDPLDDNVEKLHGQRWKELPQRVRNQFENFSIRVFELTDYRPNEPFELFFRLNQPTNLTEAEKRNAFIGGPRNQVKDLVSWAQDRGMQPDRIGFSNARMAYDDLIARFLLTVEQESLLEKVTAMRITTRYRGEEEFDDRVLSTAKASLEFVLSLDLLDQGRRLSGLKPNKATLHTWLCIAAELHRSEKLTEVGDDFAQLVALVEQDRASRDAADIEYESALAIFNDRATSRVADVSSVLLRDLTSWMILSRKSRAVATSDLLAAGLASSAWKNVLRGRTETERALTDFAYSEGWGAAPWL